MEILGTEQVRKIIVLDSMEFNRKDRNIERFEYEKI